MPLQCIRLDNGISYVAVTIQTRHQVIRAEADQDPCMRACFSVLESSRPPLFHVSATSLVHSRLLSSTGRIRIR
jgi:hypothetical protein